MAGIDPPTRAELIEFRDLDFTREEIADYYKVPLSRVKRWLKNHGFTRIARTVGTPIPHNLSDDLPYDTGMTMMERAKMLLGTRLVEDRHRGYILDGRPTNTAKILEVAGLEAVKRV